MPHDIANLWTFWQSLPAEPPSLLSHDIALPFYVRRAAAGGQGLFAGR